MTGAEFETYLLQSFKRTDKTTEIYNALTDVVMDIKIQMNSEDFKTERCTAEISVAGNYTFAAQSNFGHLIGDVTLVNPAGGSWPLIKVSKTIFDAYYPGQHQTDVITGSPRHYCVFGKTFYIGPTPDLTTYKYQYNYTTEAATAMNSATAAVPFCDRYRQYVKDMVLARLYLDLDDDEKATKYLQLGAAGLLKIINNENNNVEATTFIRYSGV
jgi:hypothetical protein